MIDFSAVVIASGRASDRPAGSREPARPITGVALKDEGGGGSPQRIASAQVPV